MRSKVFAFVFLLFFSSAVNAHAEPDRLYNKIMQSQTIDCGYADWPPFLLIDPTTHEVSGIVPDIWETIGKKLGLKIVWKSFIGWGEITEAVRSNKIDIFCVGIWPDAGRIKNMLLSRPMFYNPIYLFARADDTRFDNNYDLLNSPDHVVVGQEGDLTASALDIKFPKAKTAHIAPMAIQSDMIQNVVSKKGDVTLLDLPYAEQYMKANPSKLRQVKGPPIAVVPVDIALATGENQLKSMIDAVLNDMINDGTIATLITKYHAVETYAPRPDVTIP